MSKTDTDSTQHPEIEMRRALDNIKEPWSLEDIQESYFVSMRKTNELIKSTDGGVLWGELSSLQDCLSIFNSCANDVFETISDFIHVEKKPGFWNTINRAKQDKHTGLLKKHIFTAATSAMALVDHERRFSKKYPLVGAAEKRGDIFNVEGLHSFIQCLRNYILHFKIAEANWQISWSKKKPKQVKFLLDCETLLKFTGWKNTARNFIKTSKATIDVHEVFERYFKCVNAYYSWHKISVFRTHSDVIEKYLLYERYMKTIALNIDWNLILTHIKKNTDPYEYLDRYLTPEEIEIVLSYPMGSEEQVDALIRFVDKYDICGPELRNKALSKLSNNRL